MTAWASGVTATLISANMIPVGYRASDGALIYNSINRNGVWDVYVMASGAKVGAPLLGEAWPLVRAHKGATHVVGDIVVIVVANSSAADEIPGSGTSNNVVLYNTATGETTQLITGRLGIIWPRLNSTGTLIAWAQLTVPPALDGQPVQDPDGFWEIHAASIVNGALENEVTYSATTPGYGKGFYEAYGFNHDDTAILFASDVNAPAGSGAKFMRTQIWSAPYPPAGPPTLLTSGSVSYHEFTFIAPNGMFDDGKPSLLVGINCGLSGRQLCRAILGAEGSEPVIEQLTDFNAGVSYGIGQVALDLTNVKKLALDLQTATGHAGYELTLP